MGGLPPAPKPEYVMGSPMPKPSATTLAMKHKCPDCGAPPGVMCVRLAGFTRVLKLPPRRSIECHEARHAKRVLAGD